MGSNTAELQDHYCRPVPPDLAGSCLLPGESHLQFCSVLMKGELTVADLLDVNLV